MKIDRSQNTPVYLQIYNSIVDEIINGYLIPEERLPSRRALAAELGVAQQTVENAYQKLVSEGYITARVGSGYYVSYEKVWDEDRKTLKSNIYNFSTNGVEISKLPFNTWVKLLKNTIKEDMGLFQHGDKEGEWCLRKSIRRLLFRTQNIKCNTEQIIIGTGAEALTRDIFDFVDSDSVILMNNYYNYRTNSVAVNSGKPIGYIMSDEDGINIEELNKYSKGFLYQKPTHDLPTAVTLSEKKRKQLCEWATGTKYIIEDSSENDFQYGQKEKTLWELSGGKNVIYLGSFSRTIAPSMKIGYIVAPEEFIEKWFKKKRFYTSRVSRIEQVTLSKFIDNGYYEKHINYMRDIYREKCGVLKNAIAESSFADSVEITGDNAGMYCNMKFNTELPEDKIVTSFLKAGVKLSSLSACIFDKSLSKFPLNTYNMGFGELKNSEIHKGIELMSGVWRKLNS